MNKYIHKRNLKRSWKYFESKETKAFFKNQSEIALKAKMQKLDGPVFLIKES